MSQEEPGRGVGCNIDEMFPTSTTVVNQQNKLIDFLHFLEATPTRVGDSVGREAQVSLSGELQVGFKVDDISVNFQYGISTNDIKAGGVATGTGAVGTEKSMATVSTGVEIGDAIIESLDSVRYRAGHEVQGAVSVVFAQPEANMNQYAGFLNGADAWCPGYQSLDFGIWFIEGNNVNFIKQADFSIDKLDGSGPSGYTINPQSAQLYRMTYAWHGFLPMVIEVAVGNKWQPVHMEVFTNTATETHLENPNLPIAARIVRTVIGSGVNKTIKTGSWRGGVVAGVEENNSSDRWFPEWNINLPVANTNWVHLATLRSKDTYQSKINHIKTLVKLIASVNSTGKDVLFAATRLAALDAADVTAIEAGMVDIDTQNSVIESSTALRTLTTQLGQSDLGDVAVVPRNDKIRNTDVQGLSIRPSEDIVFIALPSQTGDISLQLNFKELH
jgi:hypothetical protein